MYSVIDVDGHAYTFPKTISGAVPAQPVYSAGHCIRGRALALFVIALDGSVTSAFVAQSTDPLLAKVASHSVGKLRFEAARLDGSPVSTVAVTRIRFTCSDQSLK